MNNYVKNPVMIVIVVVTIGLFILSGLGRLNQGYALMGAAAFLFGRAILGYLSLRKLDLSVFYWGILGLIFLIWGIVSIL
ncbi:hypothetical protein GPK34_08755 [Secundilactobacillus kimchicus]|uniref:Uncharacterized protein n=1 Tax=Secundilactobacillus kimchicus JCM 15530 TaxID=1302272 RepID=A0A0R1HPA2_9LACO|nr:hypothetical protein [Secundilactobacillus kimchicus]KRK48661.1 hypothetical protein FC96_GL000976 [Secundilactobacillus kimchicus JCM 15530]MBT9672118.1 hypothetical protein [Secundilactobacillus kimchicus]